MNEIVVNTSHVFFFDVMDTLVLDPVFRFWPKAWFKENQDPTSWREFEKNEIDESTYRERSYPHLSIAEWEARVWQIHDNYTWMPGMERLLQSLKNQGCQLFGASNYPDWINMTDQRLGLSNYIDLRFTSFRIGLRKPDEAYFNHISSALGLASTLCVFIDDRLENIEGAKSCGWKAFQFNGNVADLVQWMTQL